MKRKLNTIKKLLVSRKRQNRMFETKKFIRLLHRFRAMTLFAFENKIQVVIEGGSYATWYDVNWPIDSTWLISEQSLFRFFTYLLSHPSKFQCTGLARSLKKAITMSVILRDSQRKGHAEWPRNNFYLFFSYRASQLHFHFWFFFFFFWRANPTIILKQINYIF